MRIYAQCRDLGRDSVYPGSDRCDFEKNIYTFGKEDNKKETHEIDHLFATDGAGSLCRKKVMSFLKKSFPGKFQSSEFREKVDLLESGYKEFFVPSP